MRTASSALIVCTLLLLSAPAGGAVITDVQSSFDEKDPFDLKLTVGYEFNNWNTLITREAFDDNEMIVPANKLEFDRAWHVMRFGLNIGLYHDLELLVDFPYIVADQSKLGIHPRVQDDPKCNDPYKSCVNDIDASSDSYADNPGGNKLTLFDLPFTGKARSGAGDLGLGIRWAPWHHSRDAQYPSWIVGVILRLPTAAIKKADNRAVGEGLFQVEMNTAISRRVTSFFEPYFDLHGRLRFATDKSLFDQQDKTTQTLVEPGQSMGLKLGAEFIPWEVASEEKHVSIEIGGGLDYVFEGREYSELFEALGTSSCKTSAGCHDTTYTREPKGLEATDRKPAMDEGFADDTYARTDGLTDVEHYALFSFWAGLDIQPIKYFEMGLKFSMAYVTPHFITFADAGKDAVGDTVNGHEDYYVTGNNSFGDNEYNPKYIEGLDEIGNRFRASQSLQWSLMVNLSGRF